MGSHFNKYSSTAIGFYNAFDPRPDYYRKMPSSVGQREYLTGADLVEYDELYESWTTNTSRSQLDWNQMYQANHFANSEDRNASYIVEERHNNLFETTLNAVYSGKFNHLKLTGGVEAKYSKGMHFKTMNDMLGANQWIDIDQFAERDFQNDKNVIQND